MFVKEIEEVKIHLQELKSNGIINQWELPYENLLTRRSAAIFFVEPNNNLPIGEALETLKKITSFKHVINEDKKLSTLKYRITFD